MDTLLIPREILGHRVAYTTCATHRHNIHKSHTHRENTFKTSGVVTSTVTETREPPPHIGKISKLKLPICRGRAGLSPSDLCRHVTALPNNCSTHKYIFLYFYITS